MGLIAGVLEKHGIRTVCLSTMEEIMEKVAPPRWLALPFPMGFPLGEPGNSGLQKRVIHRALELLEDPGPGPVRATFDPGKDD